MAKQGYFCSRNNGVSSADGFIPHPQTGTVIYERFRQREKKSDRRARIPRAPITDRGQQLPTNWWLFGIELAKQFPKAKTLKKARKKAGLPGVRGIAYLALLWGFNYQKSLGV